ncbi:EamA family transporter [Acetobacter estunensis]|uniref:EamA family transporter n=1 Tax=Acetobacter estunensis TaxID=104097 RepID=UPI001C2DEA93|nr:EamA family transporter [Acetobacter estunensis]MBV1837394.1 EamA family transporter [Acetobacter estunensis]
MDIFWSILCVCGIAIGQILFKISASGLKKAGTMFDVPSLAVLTAALALYGITTIGWVWVLQRAELGRVYPFMALAFVIVPVLSHFFLHESFNRQYMLGVGLIIAGIVVSLGGKA